MKNTLTHNFILALVYIAVTLLTTPAEAHCRIIHPHHCIEDWGNTAWDFGKDIYGGTKKRAKMVWNDPIGSAINPLKIIDKSIPSPMSYVEYLIKNPDEIVETLKNPVAGVVGMPVAMAISDGRNAALKKGVRRIPAEIRAQLSMYFDEKLLNSVRYTSGSNIFGGVTQGIALNTGATAITLINVIVFKNEALSRSQDLWSHEMFHVLQYKKMGLSEFAATLTLDGYKNKGSAIEKPAYKFDELFTEIRTKRHITSRLLVGLGGKCLSAVTTSPRSLVTLETCRPTERRQMWELNENSEIRLPNTNLCLDVQWGKTENRTPLHIWPCNGGIGAQSFLLSAKGEIKNSLRKNVCIEAAGGNSADGTPIQIFDCNNTSSQFWEKPSVNQITSNTNLCVQASSSSKGSLVRLANCQQGNLLQMWSMANNKGEIRLIASPDKCLDVRWSNKKNGTPLHIWPCNGGIGAQSFHLTADMQLKALGKCVDYKDTSIQINSCSDNKPTQFWNKNISESIATLPNRRINAERVETLRQ